LAFIYAGADFFIDAIKWSRVTQSNVLLGDMATLEETGG
jgi:hypothetical protein